MKEKLFKLFVLIMSMMTVISCGSDDDDNVSGNGDNNLKEQNSIIDLWQLTEVEEKGSWTSASSANLDDSYIELCSDGSFNCYGKAFGWGRGNYKSDATTVWLYYGQTLSMTIQIQSHERTSMQVIATSADNKTVISARLRTASKSQILKDVDVLREKLIGQWKLTDWGEEGNWKEINPIEYDYGYYALTFYEYGQVECVGLNTSLTVGYDLTNAQVNVLFRDGVRVSNVSDKYMTVTIDQQFGNYLRLRYTKQSSTDSVIDPTEIAARRLSAFKDSLCSNFKYVTRETFLGSYSFTPQYEIVKSQTDYLFTNDGTGIKKIIEMTSSWQGFETSEEKFKWSVSDDNSKFNINIMFDNHNSQIWKDVKIGYQLLSGVDISLQREKVFSKETTLPEEIESYSVSNMYISSFSTNEIPKGYVVSPCILSLYFKDGKVSRFVFSNLNARGANLPIASNKNGNYTFKDCKLYLEIGHVGEDEVTWPLFLTEEEKQNAGAFNLPIGTYIGETDMFIPIDNNVIYDFPR